MGSWYSGPPPDGLNATIVRGNRVLTDEFNAVAEKENVYAIGDVAQIKSEAVPNGHPMLASVAGQQGSHLAKNLNSLAKKKPMKPFKYTDKGTMATIGRNLSVVDLPFLSFSGLFACLTWMFAHLMPLVD